MVTHSHCALVYSEVRASNPGYLHQALVVLLQLVLGWTGGSGSKTFPARSYFWFHWRLWCETVVTQVCCCLHFAYFQCSLHLKKHRSDSIFYFRQIWSLFSKSRVVIKNNLTSGSRTVLFLEIPMPVSVEDVVQRLGKTNPGITGITDKPEHSSRMCIKKYICKVMKFLSIVCFCCPFSIRFFLV